MSSLLAMAIACGEDNSASRHDEPAAGGAGNTGGRSSESGGAQGHTGGSASGGRQSTGGDDGHTGGSASGGRQSTGGDGGTTGGSGTGGNGSGGTGGVPASGGLPNSDIDFSCAESGAAGSAGFGGEGGAGNEVSLMPLSENWVGVCGIDFLGAYYTVSDEAGSTITPNCHDEVTEDCLSGPDLCVAGRGARVVNGNYGRYWGTILGLALCDAETGQCPAPPEFAPIVDDWEPSSYGLTELSFNVTGLAPSVRLTIQTIDGTQYCRTVDSAESISLSTLTEACWTYYGTPYAGQPITHIMWQIPTNEWAATVFDFCIENVRLR